MRSPSPLVRPIERSTPNSQMASVTFCVDANRSKKKAMKREMQAITATKMLKIELMLSKLSMMSFLSKM